MVQPASENARRLAALISDELKISIESANSDEKSADKSADSNIESADSMTVLTKRQEQILTIMEEGREYTTEAIAGITGDILCEPVSESITDKERRRCR